MGYRITGDRSVDMQDGRGTGVNSEFSNEASEALAIAGRLRKAGYDVQIIDRDTGQPCDEASLGRGADLERR